VPLFDQQQKSGWGYIDLLGVNAEGLPVVVELKKGAQAQADGKTQSTETPLRMILEAAAYAAALRRNWDVFRRDWVDRLRELNVPESVISKVPGKLDTVPLVAAAPASFWIDWLPVTEKGMTVSPETWKWFKALLDEMRRAGLPASFVSISGFDGLSTELAVQPLVGFPIVNRLPD
jgi:hypothetical protein